MARIDKAEHARILHRIDVERCRVADVAAEYGCTPANIYALAAKLRRSLGAAAPAPAPEPPRAPVAEGGTDLFAVATPAPPAVSAPVAPARAPVEVSPPTTARTEAEVPAPATVTPLAGRRAAPIPGGTGYGLVLRTVEGEESVAPFRSIEDLLSAVKPILRTAARSAEAVWFSIRPIDLASLEEEDAA